MVTAEDGAVESETTQPDLGSALDAAAREFCLRAFDMQIEWDALAAALRAADPVEISICANDLVCAWRGAGQASKALSERVVTAQEHERRAQFTLRKHGRAIRDLFQRALAQAADPPLQVRLGQLFAELGPPDDAAPADRGGTSDTVGPSDAPVSSDIAGPQAGASPSAT